jgi:hypothetical protein
LLWNEELKKSGVPSVASCGVCEDCHTPVANYSSYKSSHKRNKLLIYAIDLNGNNIDLVANISKNLREQRMGLHLVIIVIIIIIVNNVIVIITIIIIIIFIFIISFI